MNTSLILGQYIPEKSIIHELDPRSKIIGTALLSLAVFWSVFPEEQILLLLLVIIIMLGSRITPRIHYQALKPFFLILALALLIQMLMTPGRGLFEFYFIKVSVEGLWASGSLGLRLLTLLFLANLLSLTTTPMAFTAALEKMLKPLGKLGFPVHELVMVMNISLRFIPLLLEEAERIRKAQLGRGADFRQGKLLGRIRRLGSVIIPVFRLSIYRAEIIATAMESRGYRGAEGRTRLNELRMKALDYVYIILSLGMCLLMTMTR
ncbi:MAG: energy-coupling factor transporter transmembrane protein EcfT [Syntrophomonas sp.]|nr:energy-coupling factor transporter transmembrane protein EcfT [Syntrophomonas sp.]